MRKFIYRDKIGALLSTILLLACKVDQSNLQNQHSDDGPITCVAILPLHDQLKFTGLDKSRFYRAWVGDYVAWSNCNPELDHTNDSHYRELNEPEILITTYIPEKTNIILAEYDSDQCEVEPDVLLRAKINIQTQELEKKISDCFYGVPKYFEFDISAQRDQIK